ELVALLLLLLWGRAAERDLRGAAADRDLDDRRALDLVVEDGRELLSDDRRGDVAEHAATGAVELDRDQRAVRVRVVVTVRVRHGRAGQAHGALEVVGLPELAVVLRLGRRL